MGGIGSGRRNPRGKATTRGKRSLDVRRLQRDALLVPGSTYLWHWACDGQKVASTQICVAAESLTLSYPTPSNTGEEPPSTCRVYLDWTDCALGGRRPWFICPEMGCSRRVAILYFGSELACRHCINLAYACQRETPDARAARRANTIRRRLGWEAGILNDEAGKPKGMHWRTFERLRDEHNAYVAIAIEAMQQRLGAINHELEAIRGSF